MLNVLHEQLGHGSSCFVCGTAHVGQKDDLLEIEERLRNVWLIAVGVEPGSPQLPAQKQVGHGGFIYHRAASDVDQHALGPERSKSVAVDQGRRAWARRSYNNKDVGTLGERENTAYIGVRRVGHRTATVVTNRASRRFEPFGYGPSDPTKPEDSDSSSAELASQWHGALCGPPPITDVAVGRRDAPQAREDQTYGQLGDSVVQHARGVSDNDPRAMCLRHVHVVVSDPQVGHLPEARERSNQVRVEQGAMDDDRDARDGSVLLTESTTLRGRQGAIQDAVARSEIRIELGRSVADQHHYGM